MTDSVTIRIPATVAREITPNGRPPVYRQTRGGYHRMRDLQNALKTAAARAVQEAGVRVENPGEFTLDYIVGWEPRRKEMDKDNLIAGLKYCQDGIAAALQIDDKYLVVNDVVQVRDPDKRGYIEVRISSAE